ncbi:MAG: hypothetical protein MI976_11515 [Pseudomonadales bacterium]|nr:hypothetical protein [Pseudomonadales bacterium]
MPFIWTDGKELKVPTNILKGRMGAKEIYGRTKTLAYLHNVRAWADKKSPTAKKLLKTIDNSKINIYLVGMDGGFMCFDSDPAPAGTIYANLNINPEVNPGGATGAHTGFEKQHPYIAFLHEVGHAVQYIETPSQFANHAKGPLSALKSDIGDAARAFSDRNHKGISYSQRKVWFTQGPISGQAWAVRLEYDNMYRHERPICVEAGEPLRDHYNDIRI